MKIKISDDVVFFFQNGKIILDHYVFHNQKSLIDIIVPVIVKCRNWIELKEVINSFNEIGFDEEESLNIISTLVKEGFFVEEKNEQKVISPFNQWSKSVNYFHFNNRILKDEKFKNTLDEYGELGFLRDEQPDLYKTYENTKIPLETPGSIKPQENNLVDLLLSRQTIRSFKENAAISTKDLSYLLYYGFGAISCALDNGAGSALFKTSPSGGGRSSIEAYPIIFNVEGIKNGLYHYSVEDHALDLLEEGNFRDIAKKIGGDQYHVGSPSVAIVYTSCLDRIAWKYKTSRGYKAAYTDVGHISQTLYLLSNMLNLGAFYVGALRDEVAEDFLKIDYKKEMVIGISGIGIAQAEKFGPSRFIRDDVTYWADQQKNS